MAIVVGRLGHFLDQMSAGFQDFLVPQPGKGYNEEKVRVNFFGMKVKVI